MTRRAGRRVAAVVMTAVVLAAGTAAVAERESAARTVVADCSRPASHVAAGSWRLVTLKTAGCQMWRSAHHLRHRHRHHSPTRTPPHPATRTARRAV